MVIVQTDVSESMFGLEIAFCVGVSSLGSFQPAALVTVSSAGCAQEGLDCAGYQQDLVPINFAS